MDKPLQRKCITELNQKIVHRVEQALEESDYPFPLSWVQTFEWYLAWPEDRAKVHGQKLLDSPKTLALSLLCIVNNQALEHARTVPMLSERIIENIKAVFGLNEFKSALSIKDAALKQFGEAISKRAELVNDLINKVGSAQQS